LLSQSHDTDADADGGSRHSGGGSGGAQAVLSALQRSGSWPSAFASSWNQPWLIRARSDEELAIKVAYLGCLLQDAYWKIGGHAAAITFGGRRQQRCGPYPGYAEQWFRYTSNARRLELWHVSPMLAQPDMPEISTSISPEPATGPPVPVRRAFSDLAEGSVVLGLGLWVPWEVPSKLLWFTVPRSLPHSWGRQVAQLASLFDTLRDGICHATADTSAPPSTALWLRTSFSVLLDRLDLAETTAELGEIAQGLATMIHLVRVARARGAEESAQRRQRQRQRQLQQQRDAAEGGELGLEEEEEEAGWQAVTYNEYTPDWRHSGEQQTAAAAEGGGGADLRHERALGKASVGYSRAAKAAAAAADSNSNGSSGTQDGRGGGGGIRYRREEGSCGQRKVQVWHGQRGWSSTLYDGDEPGKPWPEHKRSLRVPPAYSSSKG
jgi:hypothetical protein